MGKTYSRENAVWIASPYHGKWIPVVPGGHVRAVIKYFDHYILNISIEEKLTSYYVLYDFEENARAAKDKFMREYKNHPMYQK